MHIILDSLRILIDRMPTDKATFFDDGILQIISAAACA